MPEIDISRWRRLQDQLEDLHAHGRTLMQQKFDLSERRRRAVADHTVIEQRRAGTFTSRPGPEQTPEKAREQVRQANQQHAEMLARPIQWRSQRVLGV